MAGATWDTQITEHKRNSRNRPTFICQSVVKVASQHGWEKVWLLSNWDTQDEIGPGLCPIAGIVMSLVSAAGQPPLVVSMLWVGQGGKGPWGGAGGSNRGCLWVRESTAWVAGMKHLSFLPPTLKAGDSTALEVTEWAPALPSSVVGG